MEKTYTVDTHAEIGDRARQEDALMAVKHPSGAIVAAVADGLGGYADGDKASKSAVNWIRDYAEMFIEAARAKDKRTHFPAVEMKQAITAGYTTACVAVVEGKNVVFFNIGDSMGMIVEPKYNEQTKQLNWRATFNTLREGSGSYVNRCLPIDSTFVMYRTTLRGSQQKVILATDGMDWIAAHLQQGNYFGPFHSLEDGENISARALCLPSLVSNTKDNCSVVIIGK